MRTHTAGFGTAYVFLTLFVKMTTGQDMMMHSAYLDPDNKYQLFWRFDDETISFRVEVETQGYVGLGFSPNGGMTGSDIILGWVDDSGNVIITDRHATGRREPEMDEQVDVVTMAGFQNDTHTTLTFSRKLDTCDEHDMAIGFETIRLIWSYSDSDPGPITLSAKYHQTNRGSKSIYLLNPRQKLQKLPDDAIAMDFINPNVSIPTSNAEMGKKDTLYWCQTFSLPKLDKKHHMIQLEPIIQPGHESLVHHILVYGCHHTANSSNINVGHECYTENMPLQWYKCKSLMYAWAIGAGTYAMPERVGLPLGIDEDPTVILMETHYDNPAFIEGLVDSSGIRLHLTPTLRQYDGGMMQMGSMVRWTQIIPPFAKKFTSQGHCLPECTSRAMEGQRDGINIIGAVLHSHTLGRALRLRHFRDGREMKTIIRDDHYDFNLQELRELDEEIKFLPGDHTIMECDYDSSEKSQYELTFGGLSTREEMCLAFVLYYPRIKLSDCSTVPSFDYLNTFQDINADGPVKFGEQFWNLDWADKQVRDEFQRHTTETGIKGFEQTCQYASTFYVPYGEKVSLPPISYTLSPRPICSNVITANGGSTRAVYSLIAVFSLYTLLEALA